MKYCAIHNIHYGSPTATIPITVCPLCATMKHLESQPAPRTYEVSNAMAVIQAVEQKGPYAAAPAVKEGS